MKAFKKFIALGTAVALLGSPLAHAQQDADSTYTYGNGYQEYRTAPNLAPAIALGAIALVAIIAVAVQNGNNDHNHCH